MAQPPAPAGGGNLLTQKLGPLATWVWLLIATVVIGAVALYLRHKKGSSPTDSSSAAGQAQPGQTAGVQQVPDIILQQYRTGGQAPAPPPAAPPVIPPAQPAPTPTSPTAGLGAVTSGLHLTAGTNGTSMTINWGAAPGASSYVVDYNAGSSSTGGKTVKATGTSTTVTGLKPGTQYAFSIVPYAGATGGARSATVTGTTAKKK